MIAVIDYKGGNIHSVQNALERIGVHYEITSDPEKIQKAERVIFPGQGRGAPTKTELMQLGIWDILPSIQAPFLGICLGMQLLLDFSEEDNTSGLGIIPGRVVRFSSEKQKKIPQMGWNSIKLQPDPLTKNIPPESFFYFANSYYVHTDPKYTLGFGQYYDEPFSAVIRKKNFWGIQAHPEKSGALGQRILENFCRLSPKDIKNTQTEFSLWPAIDLIAGKCVRLTQGKYDQKTEYSESPLQVARNFEQEGASGIHIIDLEGAKAGKPCNADVIIAVAQKSALPVQTGGGIRNYEDAAFFLENGVNRIILSTAAVENPGLIRQLLHDFGAERILISVDIKNRMVAIKGWEQLGKPLDECMAELKEIGITNIIFTDIAQDGMLKGPNFTSIATLQNSYPEMNLLIAGGVSSAQDIAKLREMNVAGAIIGKALYEGKISLREVTENTPKNIPETNTPSLAKRVVACMDVKDGRVVKGINYTDFQEAGDPVALGKRYSEMGVDELVFLDITATTEKRKTVVELVKKISAQITIPFTVGGGMQSIKDIRSALAHGADKVSIESAAVTNPKLIAEAANIFGSQCIVVSLSVRKKGDVWKVYTHGGNQETEREALEFAQEMEQLGAGELLVNSLDRDGTKSGYDLELLRSISESVSIPVIASSGAGSKKDFLAAFTTGKCDAALAASLFHFGEIDIAELRTYLRENNILLRTL